MTLKLNKELSLWITGIIVVAVDHTKEIKNIFRNGISLNLINDFWVLNTGTEYKRVISANGVKTIKTSGFA